MSCFSSKKFSENKMQMFQTVMSFFWLFTLIFFILNILLKSLNSHIKSQVESHAIMSKKQVLSFEKLVTSIHRSRFRISAQPKD